MFWLKGCSKCGGDLFLEGEDWQCLQCGSYQYGALPWSQLLQQSVTGADTHPRGRRKNEKYGSEKESTGGMIRV